MKRILAFLIWGFVAAAQPPQQATQERPHMEHRFDPARSAKSLENPERDAWQRPDQVLAALELKPGQIVADTGAGTGYFSARLARHASAPKVYAADIEPRMVDYPRQRAEKEGLKNMTAVLASETSANLPEPVDCVLIVNTYHHIGQRVNYFRLLAKSLKPRARVAIIDFKKGAPSGPPEHFRFTPQEIQAELAPAGLKLEVQHDFLPDQIFLIFRTDH